MLSVKETKGNTTDSERIDFTAVLQPRTVWAVTWTVRFAGVTERESILRDLEIFTRQKKLQKDLSKSHMNMVSEPVRISGNEPTLCKSHLLDVIRAVELSDPALLFVLETNGIKLGENEKYVDELSKCHNLHVRLSFKTGTPDNFERITNRPKEWFELQIKAVENLYHKNVSFHPAIVKDYADAYLVGRLSDISPEIVERIEYESLRIYAHIRKRMKERGLVSA